MFSSYSFIFFFLPLALLGYYAAPKKLRHLTLTIFSYIFYGWANPCCCDFCLRERSERKQAGYRPSSTCARAAFCFANQDRQSSDPFKALVLFAFSNPGIES